MLEGIAILIILQLCGEVIAGLTRLPVPGPVLGLALLVAYALWRGHVPPSIEAAGDAAIIASRAASTVVRLASTAITMVATALIFRFMSRKEET